MSRLMLGWLLCRARRLRPADRDQPVARRRARAGDPAALCAGDRRADWCRWRWRCAGSPVPTGSPSRRFAWLGSDDGVPLPSDQARRHRFYGSTGLMLRCWSGCCSTSRSAPPNISPPCPRCSGSSAPNGCATLNLMLTLDVVLLSSLYVVVFVAGLRRLPTFPRLLAAVWVIDLTVQAVIAFAASLEPGSRRRYRRRSTDCSGPMSSRRWPVSRSGCPICCCRSRVNVTFRHRVPA